MIKLEVIGNLGGDARVNVQEAGSVANFAVAHTEKWKVNGVQKERTIWTHCSLWDREALHPYLKKGVKVYVEGTPGAGSYVDRDGQTVLYLKLTVFKIELLSKSNSDAGQNTTSHQSATTATTEEFSDDLPF